MVTNYFEVKKKVFLFDTDATGIVYHARHLEWMEMARVEMLKSVYKPFSTMLGEDHTSLIPIDVHLRYLKPSRFEDELIIRTTVKKMDRFKITFIHEIYREGQVDHRISEAEIILICIDTITNKPKSIPQELITIFQKFIN